jgi:16S rRNA (cytosine1402-N4)-methyltransferase
VATLPRLPHEPVLYREIIHALQPRTFGLYVDATVGAGGHARGILEACAPDGQLLGLDVDPQALEIARETLAPYGQRAHLMRASYASLLDAMGELGWQAADGILFDLGVSSMQLDTPERGFSFQYEAPLDMRFDPEAAFSAADLVNQATEAELADILWMNGEERHARKIAHMIVAERPIRSTTQLASLVRRCYRGHVRIHPATRTFQALRMSVNHELANLEDGIQQAVAALKPGGRLAVISFHSMEDRTVKRFIRARSAGNRRNSDEAPPPGNSTFSLREITRKPLGASEDERKANPRARSAKLRVAERI